MSIKVGLGQDSHRIREPKARPFILGGIEFDVPYSLEGNSDSDVILHAITNAISGVTGQPILGPIADNLCKDGVIDSKEYLWLAVADLTSIGYKVSHVSISLECLRPKILPKVTQLREHLAKLLSVDIEDVAITATTGEGLTDFGKGLGIQAIAVLTAEKA